MVQYARTDAHYLLYIANCLLFELKQVNGMSWISHLCLVSFICYITSLHVIRKYGENNSGKKVNIMISMNKETNRIAHE